MDEQSPTQTLNPNGSFTKTRAPAIAVQNLSLHYGRQPALQNVTLRIAPAGITAVIGPSGCGKTSFLMCLNRLTDMLPGCRPFGDIEIGETDVLAGHTDVVTLRHRVGMIFQKPNPFPLSIRKNLELPLREHGMRRRSDIAEKSASALAQVGLWNEVKDRLNSPALALSGGQQQRLCLARALVLEPEVLLLDEPCSALDPIATRAVEGLIAEMRGRYTIVIVTHNLGQARRLADRAALFWLQDGVGRLIEEGPVAQIFDNPQERLTEAYINGREG